ANGGGPGVPIPGGGVKIQARAQHNIIGTNGDGIGDALEGNVISGNVNNGIHILSNNTSFNIVAGNLIGLAADGTSPLGNFIGIDVDDGPSFNTIGGAFPAARNVISANGNLGIFLDGRSDTTSNLVEGNYLGTDVSGELARGNASWNIFIVDSDSNTINQNVISASQQGGISIYGAGATNNLVENNLIGTDALGTHALGNAFD